VKDFWLPEEDAILRRAHAVTGNKWTAISAQLPGRSALCVKNRWNWLKRHEGNRPSAAPSEEDQKPTEIEEVRKPSPMVFEPIKVDGGIFGMGFRKFQARMLEGNGWPCNKE
jgi:hypothetical protein